MIMNIRPVGVTFYKDDVAKLKVGDKIKFEHRPVFFGSGDNKKEYPNAIALLHDGKQVGSLAESTHHESPQQIILNLLKEEYVTGTVSKLVIPHCPKFIHKNSGSARYVGDKFKQTYEVDVDVPEVKNIVKSFNEDVEVNFDEVSHTYTVGTKELVSATTWLKQYFEPFDKIMIADRCSKAWKVDSNSITDMWESNGQISASFGTAIHNALEHYDKFKDIGEIILENSKKTENPALPKHPLLRQIILDFQEIKKDNGNVVPEAIVTNIQAKLCGTIDRLIIIDEDKKICRVGDYKVNIGAQDKGEEPKKPFDYLPNTKLSKYQLQMSYYAYILTLSGWTVEGIDAYVYEDEWKHYELDIIKLTIN